MSAHVFVCQSRYTDSGVFEHFTLAVHCSLWPYANSGFMQTVTHPLVELVCLHESQIYQDQSACQLTGIKNITVQERQKYFSGDLEIFCPTYLSQKSKICFNVMCLNPLKIPILLCTSSSPFYIACVSLFFVSDMSFLK